MPTPVISPNSSMATTGTVYGPGKSKVISAQNLQTRGAFTPEYSPTNFTAQSISASVTIDSGQLVLQVNAASAAVIVTLPRAYYANGQFIHIIKTDAIANQVSAIAQTGDTVNKAVAKAWPIAQYETVTLVAQVDTSGLGVWYVIQ
jgi:hypothetical protein